MKGVLITLGVVLALAGGWIATRAISTVTGVANQTFNATNVIYNYEWFHRQYNDILAIDANINITAANLADFAAGAGPRSSWSFTTETEHGRLNSIVNGLRGQRSRMVGEYNSRASMLNRALFLQDGLPTGIAL